MFLPVRASRPWGRRLLLPMLCLGPVHAWAEEPAPVALNKDSKEAEIVVSGSRPHPTRAGDPTVAAYIVRREDLETPGRGLADALRQAPGIQVTQLGGLGSPATARLRGATSAQTPVYFGSVRLNDEVGGVADLGLIPPAFVESVQVYRSHAPKTAAEFGMGGAIFITPRRAADGASLVRFDLGSFGTRSLSLARGLSSTRRATQMFVSLDGAKNDYTFRDTQGTLFVPGDDRTVALQNADSSGWGAWVQHKEEFHGGETELFFGHATREQGAPKLALVPTREARVNYDRTILQLTSRLYLKETKVELLSAMVISKSKVHDPLLELSPFSGQLETPGERFEEALTFEHELSKRWSIHERISASVERFRRYEDIGGELTAVMAAQRLSPRALVGVDFEAVPGLKFSAVGEFKCVSTSPLSACAEPLPAGRVGATWTQRAVEVFASVGRAVRVPTLSELFGFSPVVRGNPALIPEEGITGEVGARYAHARSEGAPLFWLDVSGFARSSENLVLFVRTAQGYLTPQNRSRSRTFGAELSVGVNPPGPASISGQISFIDSRDTSPERTTRNDFLPFISPWTASLVGNVRLLEAPRYPVEWSAGVRAFYQSSRFADPAGLGVIPEQSNLDLETTASLPNKALLLRGTLRNLLDTSRFDVVGFPLPGRSVFFSLETQFK
jgi:vitamin B12 transporter